MSCHRGFNSDQFLCHLHISARGSCLTSRRRAAAPACAAAPSQCATVVAGKHRGYVSPPLPLECVRITGASAAGRPRRTQSTSLAGCTPSSEMLPNQIPAAAALVPTMSIIMQFNSCCDSLYMPSILVISADDGSGKGSG